MHGCFATKTSLVGTIGDIMAVLLQTLTYIASMLYFDGTCMSHIGHKCDILDPLFIDVNRLMWYVNMA